MATLYRRAKHKHAVYWIQYRDHTGRRRTVKGFSDRQLSEQLAAKLETEERLKRTGLVDPEQARLQAVRGTDIATHLAAFESSLADNTPKYTKLLMSRIRKLIVGCGCETLADLDPEAIRDFLREHRRKTGFGHRTFNHYAQAMDAFGKWCVTTKRLTSNPVLGIERLNAQVDVRHPRRALSPEEFDQLVRAARESRTRVQGFSGEQRARVYLLSYMTGLRKNELASLTPASFDFDASPPTLTVQAAFSKHRRKDVLPLHVDLAAALPKWFHGRERSQRLFPGLERKKTWLMVKKDLLRAGIPYRTEEGIADFHAAGRHSHITQLLRNGATLPEAKELARHSDVKMTMRYAHIGIQDQARALASLPTPAMHPEPAAHAAPAESAALQMRCTSGGTARQPVTMKKGGRTAKKDENPNKNPCRSRGYVASGHPKAWGGKVEAAGIERTAQFPQAHTEAVLRTSMGGVSALCLHSEGTFRHGIASSDNLLRRVVELWPSLPPSIKRAVYATCVEAVLLGD